MKELKAFRKVQIKASEVVTVEFTLTEDDLACHWPDGRFEAEAGDFQVFVGTNSVDVLEGEFELR